MKKTAFVLFLGIASIYSYSQIKIQGYEQYNRLVDSLTVTLGNMIEENLQSKGFCIPKQLHGDMQLVGNNIVLEVYFKPNRHCILTLYAASDAMVYKYINQTQGIHFMKQAYFDAYKNEAQKNNRLSYDIVKSFRYQFISPYYESPKDHAIYGNYEFSVGENGKFSITWDEVEILEGEDEFKEKYKSNF